MEDLRIILHCFLGSAIQELLVAETFTEFRCEANGALQGPIDSAAMIAVGEHLGAQSIILRIQLDGEESPHVITDLSKSSVQRLVDEISQAQNEAASAHVFFHLTKRPSNEIKIVNPEAFFKWLTGLPFAECIERFDGLLRNHDAIYFSNTCFVPSRTTRGFVFCTGNSGEAQASPISLRSELTQLRREHSTSDWGHLILLPDDFSWDKSDGFQPLNSLFSRIENFLAVVSLANATIKVVSEIKISLVGHVAREQVISFRDIPFKTDPALRSLFQWTYRSGGGGPVAEKLGLVRNFVSLYWNGSIFGQDLNVVAGVKAGFNMYLKRNLKDFVEVRSKVTAFLLELDAKATKAVEVTATNLEKNLYGVVTFFTTVILIKAVQDKTLMGAFSDQVAIIGWVLIGISAIHMLFAWCSSIKDAKRAEELYDDLKDLYSAFFTSTDFDSLFSSTSKGPTNKEQKVTPLKRTQDYIIGRVRVIISIWAATLIIFALLIFLLRAK